jgi:hypothetical protein
VGNVLEVNLSNLKDSFRWTASKKFSVKDLYNDLVLRSGMSVDCWAWKAKISLRIKIFLWYLKNGVVLTKDNLVKDNGRGVLNVVSVMCLSLSNICFLIVPWPNLRGGSYVSPLGLKKPINVRNLVGPWLKSFSKKKKQRNLVLTGVAAFC